MMTFRTLKQSIVDLLANNRNDPETGDSRFQVIGFQRQGKAAQTVKGNSRLVQVYYSSGQFPKSSGRVNASQQHAVTYRIEATVSEPAKVNLSILNSTEASVAQKAEALAQMSESADLADESIDEILDIIWNIIQDARNIELGLSKGSVGSRRIDSIQKDNPIPRGELVILTANMILTCTVNEQVSGEIGTPTFNNDTVIDIDGDDVEKTGVITNT